MVDRSRTKKMSLDTIVARARALEKQASSTGRRILLGVTGAPGAGKSTVTEALKAALGPDIAIVPMDGFHFANEVLEDMGRRDRKGAPDTFDVGGYVALLERLRQREETVFAPKFDRDLEESIGSALPVVPAIPLVVTEGNYLLHDRHGWNRVRPMLDEVWHLDVPRDELRRRLVSRRLSHGHVEPAASAWVDNVDLPNHALVDADKYRADVCIEIS